MLMASQLSCYSYLSFVPQAGSRRALTSDALYANHLYALEQRMNTTHLAESPALNYDFDLQQYPIPGQTPDMEEQIQRFLALPPEPIAPRNNTLALGCELWNLEHLELGGSGTRDGRKCRRRHGLATIRASQSPVSKSAGSGIDSVFRLWSSASKSNIKRLADVYGPATIDERELECFRLVVPTLLDVTLAPGWQGRPEPPSPHNKAEQMRNAAVLTKKWNFKMEEELGRCVAEGRARPRVVDEEGIEEAIEVAGAGSILEYALAALRSRGSPEGDTEVDESVIHTPCPRRGCSRIQREFFSTP